jgi:hypothetical protein
MNKVKKQCDKVTKNTRQRPRQVGRKGDQTAGPTAPDIATTAARIPAPVGKYKNSSKLSHCENRILHIVTKFIMEKI